MASLGGFHLHFPDSRLLWSQQSTFCAGPFHRQVCPGNAVLQEKNKFHLGVSSEITEVTSIGQLPPEIRDANGNHFCAQLDVRYLCTFPSQTAKQDFFP